MTERSQRVLTSFRVEGSFVALFFLEKEIVVVKEWEALVAPTPPLHPTL